MLALIVAAALLLSPTAVHRHPASAPAPAVYLAEISQIDEGHDSEPEREARHQSAPSQLLRGRDVSRHYLPEPHGNGERFRHHEIGFQVLTTFTRLDYGVRWNRAVEGGGAMLGDDVTIGITMEAVSQTVLCVGFSSRAMPSWCWSRSRCPGC